MKNKTKRYDILLLFVFMFIMLYFIILNFNEQQYFKDFIGYSYNKTAIIDLDIKIYPMFLGKNLPTDNIVPTGSLNFVNVIILNIGPSDLCASQLTMRICDPSMNCRDNSEGYFLQKDNINPLKMNEKYTVLFGGHIPDKDGRWKYNFELTPLPPYCNIHYSGKVGEKRDILEFEAVSLDAYYQYRTNKDVENLTIIILFVSLITIAFSFNKVRAYTKKLIKTLTQGWFK